MTDNQRLERAKEIGRIADRFKCFCIDSLIEGHAEGIDFYTFMAKALETFTEIETIGPGDEHLKKLLETAVDALQEANELKLSGALEIARLWRDRARENLDTYDTLVTSLKKNKNAK